MILSTVTLLAATLQTVTGFGFGLLCVPVFLWVVDSIAAIQLVIIVTLVMSIAILPAVKSQMMPKLLIAFGIGSMIGSPIGIAVLNTLNLDWLKILAASVILTVTLWNAYQLFAHHLSKNHSISTRTEGKQPVQIGVGVASGIMGTTLAMPAPLVMLYLSTTSHPKQAIRGTVLVFFILAYGLALLCQMLTQGIETHTWKTAALLTPCALFGVWLGDKIAPSVSVFYFKIIIMATLVITSMVMLISVI